MFRYIRFKVAKSHMSQDLKSAHSPIAAAEFERVDGWQRNRQVIYRTKVIKRCHKDVCNDNGSREK